VTDLPEQPTLRTEGGVVLRPWNDDDVALAARLSDDAIRTKFDAGMVRRWREEYTFDRRVVAFAVEQDGELAGSVEIRQLGDRRGELSWATFAARRGRGIATAAVRRAIAYGFEDLGLERVEARVEPDNRASLRVATRSGMRVEGRMRSHETADGTRRDYVLLARLAHDPDIRERDGFIGILNSSLPRKRVISQGLLRDERGRILLCELTYKHEWDLPGGVIEPNESPADGLLREIHEELGISATIYGLRTVNWLPAWRGWDDACVLVFDLGTVESRYVDQMVLQRTEIVDVHWCDVETVRARATDVTIELLDALAADAPPYREHGR